MEHEKKKQRQLNGAALQGGVCIDRFYPGHTGMGGLKLLTGVM